MFDCSKRGSTGRSVALDALRWDDFAFRKGGEPVRRAKARWVVICAAWLFAAQGCSGGGGGVTRFDGGGPTPDGGLAGLIAQVPDCPNPDELVVAGRVNGVTIPNTVVPLSVFGCFGNPVDPTRQLGGFSVFLKDGGVRDGGLPPPDGGTCSNSGFPTVLRVDFQGTVILGGVMLGYGANSARGAIDLPTLGLGSTTVGNCDAPGDFPGGIEVSADGRVVGVVLRDLHRPPYCSGAPVSGYILGCFRLPPP